MDSRILDKVEKIENNLQYLIKEIKRIKFDLNSLKDSSKDIKNIQTKVDEIEKRIPKNNEKLLKTIRNKIDEIDELYN